MESALQKPPIPTSTRWQSFKMAAWLGWKIESNWTDPFLFAVYSIVKPLSGAAILVIMYSVITQGNFSAAIFPYIYLGNAFYGYVASVMTGVSWAVIDDREHYRTLKYLYVAPIHIPIYLLGRGVSRFVIGTFSVIVVIAAGMLFLNLQLDLAAARWGLFFLSLAIGVIMLSMFGLILAGVTLRMARHAYIIGDTVAGAMFLFSGAVFPLEVLPAFLRPIGFANPITYWLELMRRSLMGQVAEAFPTLAGLSDAQLLGILTGLTVVFAVLAVLVFRWCDRTARDRGLIDFVSNY